MTSIRRPRDHRLAVLAAALLSGAASAYLALAGFFDAVRNGPAVVLCVAVVAGVAIGSTAATLLTDGGTAAALAKRMEIRTTLDTGCVAFHNITSEGVEVFGATLLLVERRRWGAPRLWSVVHGGLALHPPSLVEWTRGTGVVGRCWEQGTTEFADLRAMVASHGACNAVEWNALPAAGRMGLTFAEWRRTAPYYGTIVAAIVGSGAGEVMGVLAIDAPPHVDLSGHAQELRDATEGLARLMEAVLE